MIRGVAIAILWAVAAAIVLAPSFLGPEGFNLLAEAVPPFPYLWGALFFPVVAFGPIVVLGFLGWLYEEVREWWLFG